jgi:hypothetical protein
MTNHRLIATAVGVGSFAVGAVVGFKVAEQRLAKQFEDRVEKETEDLRVFYTNAGSTKKYATPEEAVKDLVTPKVAEEALREYAGKDGTIMYNKVVKSSAAETVVDSGKVHEITTVERNVFEAAKERNPDEPYIISQEEFMENEPSYNQSTVTYYVKDDVLTDERDDVIEEVENVLGLDFKVSFGEGSSDENSVHVRNERLQMDFEVMRDEDSYAQKVLGLEDSPVEPPNKRIRGS